MTAVVSVKEHVHEWERGKHMAEAFGVDGRRYYCAICGIPYWCMAQRGSLAVCDIHGGFWPEGAKYCEAHGPDFRWVP
jgi:hypothetical protein